MALVFKRGKYKLNTKPKLQQKGSQSLRCYYEYKQNTHAFQTPVQSNPIQQTTSLQELLTMEYTASSSHDFSYKFVLVFLSYCCSEFTGGTCFLYFKGICFQLACIIISFVIPSLFLSLSFFAVE